MTRLLASLGLLAALAAALGWSPDLSQFTDPSANEGQVSVTVGHQATRGQLKQVMGRVKVVDHFGARGGYDADRFGEAWTDDTSAPGGHNGCNTRDDVLAAQLKNIKRDSDCDVIGGRLRDPYTGQRIGVDDIDIDHIYPRARAWAAGASRWSQAKRARFANDLKINLLAVSASANRSKGDQGPGEWLPDNTAYRCTYVWRYMRVAAVYQLPVTRSDMEAARQQLPHCRTVKKATDN